MTEPKHATPADVAAELFRIQTMLSNLFFVTAKLTPEHIAQVERLYHLCGRILDADHEARK